MEERASLFRDRYDAGRRLAQKLIAFKGSDTLVLALPRGGVPVGYEIAHELEAQLDIIVARKLGAPGQPELGIGAIAPGVRIINETLVRQLGIAPQEIDKIAGRETAEMQRRLRLYRSNRPAVEIAGKTVILTDDGLATGITALAATRAVRAEKPERLILAVPVCSPEAAARLAGELDDLVCLLQPEDFMAVGQWYLDFTQTSDEEVMKLLQEENNRETKNPSSPGVQKERAVIVSSGLVELEGNLVIPDNARGVVLFAHGSGSSRFSPRNRFVARALQEAGIATLLIDLLTAEEEAVDIYTLELRFDIDLLAERLIDIIDWLRHERPELKIGLFGASTGGAATLVAASKRPESVSAVVSRGGRPDMARNRVLSEVRSPTLLIVGGDDTEVLKLNRQALRQMHNVKELAVIPGATHLFEEPGALEKVSRLATQWFLRYLIPPAATKTIHG
ncbi:MAG: alpha/beta family hydrolase [bacterium]